MQTQLVAGDSLTFRKSAPDHPPADGWTMKIRLVGRSSALDVTLTAAADGAEYLFDVSPTTTASWAAGEAAWFSWVEKTPATLGRVTLETGGQLTIAPNPATVAVGTDLRSQAQKALDDAKTALAAWSPTKRAYTIGGRSMQFNSKAEIIGVIRFWQAQVDREDIAAGRARELSGRIYSRL